MRPAKAIVHRSTYMVLEYGHTETDKKGAPRAMCSKFCPFRRFCAVFETRKQMHPVGLEGIFAVLHDGWIEVDLSL